jgi:hypothetical protein
MLFIVNIVVPEVVVGGWGWTPAAPNLCGEICPPSYNNLKIIVSWGRSFESGS